MVNTSNVIYELIKKSGSFETTKIEEVEEVIDYGLEKNEENYQKVALEYLEERGFAKRIDNLDRAKQHVIESSAFSDTVCVRKRREIVEDLLAEAEDSDLDRLATVSILEKLIKIDEKLTRLSCPRYEYAVEVVSEVLTEADNFGASLTEFESFEMMLNRYASSGWHVQSITAREGANNKKISMTGFSANTKQVVVVFERLR